MANELVARRGLRVSGETFISTITADTLANSYASVLVHGDNDAVASVSLENVLTGATEANNVITFTDVSGNTTDVTIDAITGASYDSSWGIDLSGVGAGVVDFELPFITGGSYSAGSITLNINGGLESAIEITGLTSTDSFATGATLTDGVLSISGSSDFTPFNVSGDSFSFNVSGDTGTPFTVNLGGGFEVLGDLGITVDAGAQGELQISVLEEYFTAATIANNVIALDGIEGLNADLTVIAFTAVSEADNVITFAGSGVLGNDSITIDAFTAATVNEWGIDFSGSVNQAIELPFITAVDLSGGELSFTVNGGGSVASVTGFSFDVSGDTGTSFSVDLESGFQISGGTGVTVSGNGSNAVVISVDDQVDTFATGGTYAASTGTITIDGNEGFNSFDVVLGADFVTGVTELDNVVTVTKNGGANSNFTIQAVTALTEANNVISLEGTGDLGSSITIDALTAATYDNDWGVNLSGVGAGVVDFELPFITGGSYNDGDLTLSINGGLESDIVISGFEAVDTFATGGTYNAATGAINITGNEDFVAFDVDLGTDFVTGVTEADNVVTVTKNGGANSNFTIQAVTALTEANNVISLEGTGDLGSSITIDALTAATYDNDWGVNFSGSVNDTLELPFITGGSYSAGTITLGINGGLEDDIEITGIDGTDTFATGSSVAFSAATIEGNDGFTAFTIDSEQTIRFSANAASGATVQILQIDGTDYETLHVEYVIHDTDLNRIRRAGIYYATWLPGQNDVIDAEQSTKNIGAWTGSEPTITVSKSGDTVTLSLTAASGNNTAIKANVRAVKAL